MQVETAHGREIIGILLFQDLAVVPLLILIPALAQPAEQLASVLAGDDASVQFNLRLGEMLRLAGEHERALQVFEQCVDRAARAGMTQGWSGSFEKLEALLG